MLHIRQEKPSEAGAREALLDLAYGPVRFNKPSQRLRAGRAPAQGLSFVATEDDGQVIGSVRLWEVAAGADRTVLLLGPLAVHPDHRQQGIGGALMRHAMRMAARRGHAAVLLVGDPAYYGRFGFDLIAARAFASVYAGPHFMALRLQPVAPFGGRVRYPAAFTALG